MKALRYILMVVVSVLITTSSAYTENKYSEYESSAKIVSAEEGTWLGTKYIVAPITVPIDIAMKLHQGKDWKKIAIQDGQYVIGYLAVVYVGGKIYDSYFFIAGKNYHDAADRISKEPQNILFVYAQDTKKSKAEYLQLFSERYPHAKVTSVEVNKFNGFLEELAKINPTEKFDRIDLFFHGNVGQMGNDIHIKNLKKMDTMNFATAGAEVRVTSCSVGASYLCGNAGPKFLKALGDKLLPEGGRVIAPTKTLNTVSQDIAPLLYHPISVGSGLSGIVRSLQAALHSLWTVDALFHHPKGHLSSAVEVRIPPYGTTGCEKKFKNLIRYIK